MYNQVYRNHSWLADTADPGTIRKTQSNLLQIDPYQEQRWRDAFTVSQWYRDIRERLPSDVKEIWTRSGLPGNNPTSREFHFNRYFQMSTFYFIWHILKNSPPTVFDLGCGGNLFRDLVPNLTGIDPYHPGADINDLVDEDFIRGHQAHFDSVMAINSLHFRGLDQFGRILDDFHSMLKPGGMGFITFGLGVMVDHTSDDAWHEIFNLEPINTSASSVITWIDTQLRDLALDLHVIDQYYFNNLDTGDVVLSNPIDGNIRVVMRRSQ
jgi:hypothetical protein